MKKLKHTAQKRSLWERFNRTCVHCRKKITLESASRDHVIPVSKGGGNEPENLVLSCKVCNAERGDKPIDPRVLEAVECL